MAFLPAEMKCPVTIMVIMYCWAVYCICIASCYIIYIIYTIPASHPVTWCKSSIYTIPVHHLVLCTKYTLWCLADQRVIVGLVMAWKESNSCLRYWNCSSGLIIFWSIIKESIYGTIFFIFLVLYHNTYSTIFTYLIYVKQCSEWEFLQSECIF